MFVAELALVFSNLRGGRVPVFGHFSKKSPCFFKIIRGKNSGKRPVPFVRGQTPDLLIRVATTTTTSCLVPIVRGQNPDLLIAFSQKDIRWLKNDNTGTNVVSGTSVFYTMGVVVRGRANRVVGDLVFFSPIHIVRGTKTYDSSK